MDFAQPYNQLTKTVTLDNCDREPVHVPGCLMPHGALLACSLSGQIEQGSTNTGELLGLPLRDLLGRSLDEAWGGPLLEALRRRVGDTRTPLAVPEGNRGDYQLVAHCNEHGYVLEWEPMPETSPVELLLGTQAALSRLETRSEVQLLCQALAEELRALFAIDRVMVYRFHLDWTGEVIAEAAGDHVPSRYLGLRFPAADIPAPARAVYEKVWLRVIQEASAAPVALEPLLHPLSGRPLDLTYSVLRAVSPMHVEYLHNMGVVGTVSCSIRVDGKLWGLVACHHYRPLILRQPQRASLEVFARVVSQRIQQLQDLAAAAERVRLQSALESLSERFEREDRSGLLAALPLLDGMLECSGVVVSHARGWYPVGDVPPESELQAIRAKVLESAERVWHTDRLPDLCSIASPQRHCGLMALIPQGAEGEVALWFRPEEASTVRWGGDPHGKEIRFGPNGPRLHPRASFAEYIEHASGRSRPWRELDMWKMTQLLRVLDAAAARTARRVQASNETLRRSNEELNSFAYMASHDLREPLRGIHHYAQFLQEDYGSALPSEGREMLNGVVSLTSRMEQLIASLLDYSRLNHQPLECCPCPLQRMAEETATIQFHAPRVAGRLIVHPNLPVVYAHPPFLEQILGNLLSNAIKYSDDDRVVEIGSVPHDSEDGMVTFFVRDNGVGIPEEFHERVFQLFRRLYSAGQRGGGSGAGLTIVRRMVERHGGKVRLESAPGQGTTVFVTMSGSPS